jgi:glutathione S-transferase
MSVNVYVLHYAPDNASLIIRYVLESAHLPYTTALVDRSIRQQETAAYRALNPTGLIPTLETPHGPLSETAAILLWLADTHALGPATDDPARPTFLKWLFFLSNTPHADLRQLFYPDQYVPDTAIAQHHAIMTVRMRRHFTLLDQAATDHATLFTPTGILAPYICALMRWSVLYPRGQAHWFDLHRFPALDAMARRVEATPAAKAVATAEGLGDTPFTAPTYAQPAFGSAT